MGTALSRVWAGVIAMAVIVLPATAYAQQTTARGTVSDSAGRVLPGVTVTALHEATGNTFQAVTDQHGAFRLAVRPGVIRITAERAGFVAASRSLELLIGRTARLSLRLVPSTSPEAAAPKDEAPPADVTTSALTGNIDPRQVQELPLNGRNWMTLTLLTPGSRLDALGETPVQADLATGPFQINLDGQQLTQTLNFPQTGQPRYSRDAIAEFEMLSRFDATQGRASGVQVNAITKSGTNHLAGTISVYGRDDRFNAADHVVGSVLPYSNQQVSLTAGGPIRRDRIHVFASYEYEREPQTFVYTTPYARFNRSFTGTRREDKWLARLDAQLSPQTRLSVRAARYDNSQPYDPSTTGGSTRTPASATGLDLAHDSLGVTLAHPLGGWALGELRVGHDSFVRNAYSQVNNANALPGMTAGKGAPQISLRGLTVGQVGSAPVEQLHDEWSVREDLLFSFDTGGRHDMKVGGEYLFTLHAATNCVACNGIYDALGGPVPANIEDLFPDIMNVATWNLAPLSSIMRSYQRSIVSDVSTASRPAGGSGFREYAPRHVYAAWVQDDWELTPRLTVNLGLRHDLALGLFANWVASPPFLDANRPNDTNNVAPRAGFAFTLTDRTSIRGGYGLYFAELAGGPALNTIRFVQRVQPLVLNSTGRPDFATNPFNGPAPTFDQASRLLCSVTPGPSCLRPSLNAQVAPDAVVPYTHQASIGLARSLTDSLSLEADYYVGADRATWTQGRNLNLAYDPAPGPTILSRTLPGFPIPAWALCSPNARTVEPSPTACRRRSPNA
jgi:hypothetical protein